MRRPRSCAVSSSERAVGNSAVDAMLSASSSCHNLPLTMTCSIFHSERNWMFQLRVITAAPMLQRTAGFGHDKLGSTEVTQQVGPALTAGASPTLGVTQLLRRSRPWT